MQKKYLDFIGEEPAVQSVGFKNHSGYISNLETALFFKMQ